MPEITYRDAVIRGIAQEMARDNDVVFLGEDVAKPVKRARVDLPESVLKQYVGEYELSPTFVRTITVEDGQLMTQATNQGKLPVVAESETVFYPTVVDATLTFQKDDSGKVTGLTLDQNGRKMPGKRR